MLIAYKSKEVALKLRYFAFFPVLLLLCSTPSAQQNFVAQTYGGTETLTLAKQNEVLCSFYVENTITGKNHTIKFQKDKAAFVKLHVYVEGVYMGMYNPIGGSWHNLAVMLANSGTQIEHLQEISRDICLHINASYKKAAVDYVNPARMGW